MTTPSLRPSLPAWMSWTGSSKATSWRASGSSPPARAGPPRRAKFPRTRSRGTMEYHHIKVEVKDAVQVITFNRPDVLNSFHLPMAREVQDALAVAAADDNIRAVLL